MLIITIASKNLAKSKNGVKRKSTQCSVTGKALNASLEW